MAIMLFIFNFTDFLEKAGFKRNRPITKATVPPTISDIDPVLINKEMKVVCGFMSVVMAVIADAIGTTIIQLFTNIALTNLPTPEGAFLYRKRLSFPRTVTSPATITAIIGNINWAIIRATGGSSGSAEALGTRNMFCKTSRHMMKVMYVRFSSLRL